MIALRWNIAQSLERLWWRNYLNGKDRKLYLDWKKNYWDGILQQVFELSEDGSSGFNNKSLRILDAGCGPAGIFLNLRIHSVDALDPLMSQYLQEHQLIDRDNYRNVRFIEEKLEYFSSPDTYDYVFCMNSINHVNEIELCLENIAAALKEDGLLVMTVDAHKYDVAKRLLSVVPADILHPYQLAEDDYTALLEKKFAPVSIRKKLIKTGILFDHYLFVLQKNQRNTG